MPQLAPVLIMAGYCAVHLLEHTINAHFHFGEETHASEFVSDAHGLLGAGRLERACALRRRGDRSGFALSNWLGWLIFLAILLHKAPEGFTMASVMMASGRSRRRRFIPQWLLAAATLAGVLVIQLVPRWVPYGLPVSAGVALYVAATDLVPEVNREPGIRMALVFFAGVAGFLLLRMLLAATLRKFAYPLRRRSSDDGSYSITVAYCVAPVLEDGRANRGSRRKRFSFEFPGVLLFTVAGFSGDGLPSRP